MVQRLTFLEKVSTKERTIKVAENAEIRRKREAKVQEKRDAHTADEKKRRYMKG